MQQTVLPGTWTLNFSGSTIIQSSFVQSFRTSFRRAVPVAQRPKLWSPTVILDGNYPAQVWQHDFLLYNEASTPCDFAEEFIDLETKISSFAIPIVLQDNAVDRIDFGSCFLEPPSLAQPQELLLYRAGYIRVRFLGNTRPVKV